MLLCSIFNCKAAGEYDDLGGWLSLTFSAHVSEQLTVGARLEQRTFDDFQSINQIYGRARAYYHPADWIRIDQNLDLSYTPGGYRVRYIPGIRFSYKTFDDTTIYFREWYMRTWYVGEGREPGNTLRSKVGVAHKLWGKYLAPHFDYEIFYWDTISQHRFYAGNRFRLSADTSLDLFYLYQLYPIRQTGTHIIGMAFSVKL